MMGDLTWLTRNLDDLENGRLNRINNRKHDTGRTPTTASASAPLREAVLDLLHVDREGNIEDTLHAWARCLNVHVGMRDSLATTAERISRTPRLDEHAATPIYAAETHTLVRRAQNLIRMMDETRIKWGNCPNPDCQQPLTAPADAETIDCPHCHCKWAPQIVWKSRDKQLKTSKAEGTYGELSAILDSLGLNVPAATIRSWAYRGKLNQTKDTHGKPTGKYRLADAYQLAVPNHDHEKEDDE
ncbi:IBR domain-containing protein [Bifidobacterium cuniculi]|nr:IBR domain-containing protein [Bifidobacterium cuniculi]